MAFEEVVLENGEVVVIDNGVAAPPPEPTFRDRFEAGVGAAGDFADKATLGGFGHVVAAGSTLAEDFGQRVARDFGYDSHADSYDENLAQFRGLKSKFSEQHPVLSGINNVAAFATPGGALKGTTAVGTAAKMGASGAVQSYIDSLLNGGDVEDATKSAAVGGGTAGTLSALGSGLGSLGKYLRSKLASTEIEPAKIIPEQYTPAKVLGERQSISYRPERVIPEKIISGDALRKSAKFVPEVNIPAVEKPRVVATSVNLPERYNTTFDDLMTPEAINDSLKYSTRLDEASGDTTSALERAVGAIRERSNVLDLPPLQVQGAVLAQQKALGQQLNQVIAKVDESLPSGMDYPSFPEVEDYIS